MSEETSKAEDSHEKVKQGIRVMARVRPFSAMELQNEEEATSVIFMKDNTVTVLDPSDQYSPKETFVFDEVFWSIPESQNQYSLKPFSSQEDVFKSIGLPIVSDVLEGYNCCVFAYGQTGSGKTHTMLGTEEDVGLSPRILSALFESLQKPAPGREVPTSTQVEVSFLEIYNERVRDLLIAHPARRASVSPVSPTHPRSNSVAQSDYGDCKVRNHPEMGTYVEGLKREQVDSAAKCMQVLKYGMGHRAVAATNLNQTSSRSHAVLQIYVKQKFAVLGTQRLAVLNLVDLAGSERIKRSGVTGQSLAEAKTINLSLSTLRRVIDVLIENESLPPGKHKGVPPYRESMLTWVLSDSLGGNSKTTMLTAVSPHASNLEDSVASLRYALKAKSIVCNVRVNEEKTAVVVSALRNQIEELKRQMKAQPATGVNVDAHKEAKKELAHKEEEYKRAVQEQAKLEAIGESLRRETKEKDEAINLLAPSLGAKLKAAEELESMRGEMAQRASATDDKKIQLNEATTARLQHEEDIKTNIERVSSLRVKTDEKLVQIAEAKVQEDKRIQELWANRFRHIAALSIEKRSNAALMANVDAYRQRLNELSETVFLKNEELDTDKGMRDRLLTKLRNVEDRNVFLIRHHEKLMADNTEVIHSITRQISGAEDAMSDIQAKLFVVREQSSAISATREAGNAVRTEEQMALQKELDAVSVHNAEIEMHIQRLTQELTRLQAKYNTLNAEIHNSEALRFENEIAEKDRSIAALTQANDEVSEELEFTNRTVQDTEEGVTFARVRVIAMQQESHGAERNRNDLRSFVKCKLHPERLDTTTQHRSASPPPYQDHQQATARRSARRAEFADELHRRGFA
jgi:hypothetical protein